MIEHAQKKSYIQNVHKKEKKRTMCTHIQKPIHKQIYILGSKKKKSVHFLMLYISKVS